MPTPEGEIHTYLLRPDRTAIWLPRAVVENLGLGYGDQLTQAEFDSKEVQEILQKRRAAERTKQ